MKPIYLANLTAGALLVPESRKIAGLMLQNVSTEEWKRAVEEENILQKLSVSSSKRVAAHIKSRLDLMKPELWQMVRDGDTKTATHAIFAAAIKHSRILGDYLDLVVRDAFRSLKDCLTPRLWEEYILSCKQRDPLMEDFPPSTALKMRSVVHKILFEAGYIKNVRSWEMQRIDIDFRVKEYLEKNNERYVLKCIEVC